MDPHARLPTPRRPAAHIFADRRDAGRRLARELRVYAGDPTVLVLALPRGGVPVAYEVARALGAPLDVFMVRKLGVPGHEELAMGAIASGGICVYNEDVMSALHIPVSTLEAAAERETPMIAERERRYRGDRARPLVTDRTVILVDDGLATGASMRAAAAAIAAQQPRRIVVAVPVAPLEACEELRAHAEEVVCALTPDDFMGVGRWYEDFTQTSDQEVRELLARATQAS